MGVLWIASEAVRFGASLSRAYRTPDFNELYSNGPHLAANSFDVGDTELDEESGIGVDAFVRYDTDRLSLELSAFQNTLDNYIFPSSRGRAETGTAGGRPRFQYTNEDARLYGFEGEAQVALSSRLVLEATASHVLAEFTSERAPIPIITPFDTTFVDASEHPPFIPPLHGRVGLRWDSPSWFAGVGTRLSAEQNRTGDFETVTPGYVVGEMTGGYRFTAGNRIHAITVRVNNLLDHEYRDHLSRVKDIMPEPGRDISLTYRLTF
jgi:iron complex outermembrane receptor protein